MARNSCRRGMPWMKIKSSMESFRSLSSLERARDPWIRLSLSISLDFFEKEIFSLRRKIGEGIGSIFVYPSRDCLLFIFVIPREGEKVDELEISIGGRLSRSVNLYLNHFVPSYQLPFVGITSRCSSTTPSLLSILRSPLLWPIFHPSLFPPCRAETKAARSINRILAIGDPPRCYDLNNLFQCNYQLTVRIKPSPIDFIHID